MKKVVLILLVVVCLLVATQVSADAIGAFNIPEVAVDGYCLAETKIDSQEDVIENGIFTDAVIDERIADYRVCSKQPGIVGSAGTLPDSGIELEIINKYSVKRKGVKPESMPYIKGL